jgi:hypothetical protein
LPERE